jgi:hypothetical protein
MNEGIRVRRDRRQRMRLGSEERGARSGERGAASGWWEVG